MQSAWANKLHPAVFEVAGVWKTATEQVGRIDAETKQAVSTLGAETASEALAQALKQREQKLEKLSNWFDEKLVDIDTRYHPLPTGPLSYPWLQLARNGPLDQEKEEIGLIEWLHSERHHESLSRTREQANSGDIDALQRLHRTENDHFRIAHRKGQPKGFQGDPYHRDLLQLGLCFGLDKLTSDELAEFFDLYCPCDKAPCHSSDALKKQRRRLIQEFNAATSTVSAPDQESG